MHNSLERIIPGQVKQGEITGEESLKLHLDRYAFAADNLKAGRILDIACGVGYGTDVVIKKRTSEVDEIVAVDFDGGAIEYGKSHYPNPKVRFQQGDAYAFQDSTGFDTIISLETIEHLPDPVKFASSLNTVLKNGGRWICSAPVTPTKDAIPFHMTDFTRTTYRKIFQDLGFREVTHLLQIQPFKPLQVLMENEERLEGVRKNLICYYLRNPASVFSRLTALLRYGFNTHYLTVVWEKHA